MRLTTTTRPAGAGTQARIRLLGLGVLMAILATVAISSWAQPMGHGPGRGMGPDMMIGGPPEHVSRMVDHMLAGLDVNDAQRGQIKQIAQAAAVDVKALRETGRGLRQSAMQVFTAPNVDANAAEALRQQMLAQHDQVSRRMLTAMLDISRVLTPDQRAKLAARAQERAAKMHDRMEHMQRERPSK